MQPKRGYLLFLLSFAAVLLYYHSSLRLFQARTALSTPDANPRNPNPSPRSFSFAVKVLTFDRADSLRRCLRSLAAADYAGERADLHVFVDHFPATNDSHLVGRKLEEARRILDLVDEFDWVHGEKLVHYRTANAGLQAQWLEAWWPNSDDEFAFVVEDDLEVSPLYYRFLKALILKYYYDRSNYSPYVYGASLQRPRFVAGKHGNKLQLDGETRLFLYQMVGTWGQLLFPKPWKEFRLWYDVHKAKGIKPILQGMVTSGWYKKMGDRIWTPWFIKFIHSRGYYNIYTNFQHERALSISHRDAGVNYRKTAGPDSKLLDESSLDLNLWEMPTLRNLKWYDFCFRRVFPRRIVSNADELGPFLDSWQKQNPIVFISLYRVTPRMARNLVCHLERVGFQNFILLGDDSELMIDLAWRGNLVIDASQSMYRIRSGKSLGLQHSEVKLAEIWVKANVVKKCLELGYNLWLIDGNIIPTSASLPELPDSSYDFFAAKDVELMYVKSSPSSLKVWNDDFNSKVVGSGKSLIGSNSGFREHMNFVHLVKKSIEDVGGVKLWKLDELTIGVKVGTGGRNHTSLEGGKKMVICPQETLSDSVQRELENLGLWLIDEDDSCVAVVCRRR